MRSLFESEDFERWRQGDYQLHLFLDSLDECLMRMDNVAALLADELPKQPVTRFRLRIACRTALWPGILETALKELFPEFQAYESPRAGTMFVSLPNKAECGASTIFLSKSAGLRRHHWPSNR